MLRQHDSHRSACHRSFFKEKLVWRAKWVFVSIHSAFPAVVVALALADGLRCEPSEHASDQFGSPSG